MADQHKGGSAARLPNAAKGGSDPWDEGENTWADADANAPVEPIRFSEIERAQHSKRTLHGLLRTVAIQLFASLLAAVIAWPLAGTGAAVSVLLGAMAYALPNAGFAFKLALDIVRFGGGAPTTFFFGELLKMTVAALLLVVIASLLSEQLVWPAFLIGLVVALKSQWLTLLWGVRNF